jgi:hypothetical protein
MNRRANLYIRHGWLLYLGWVFSLIAAVDSTYALDLITYDEAKQTTKSFDEGEIGSDFILLGPSIEIRHGPRKGDLTSSPFKLEIHFIPGDSATINPDSIEIRYWSWPRVILTSRIKPFLKGNVISIADARAPRGRHEIEIKVKDSKGYDGILVYEFEVHK